MDEDKLRLISAAIGIRQQRRYYNDILIDVINGESEEYNAEDLMRLVGTLEAAFNHCLASVASDNDIYCTIKHLSYAIILVGEMNHPDVEPLYDILSIVTNGKLEACSACKQDRDNIKERRLDGTVPDNQDNQEDNS